MRVSRYLGVVVVLALTGAIGFTGVVGKPRKTEVNGIEWFNSMPDALAESKRTGRPILLLSMFGKIDEAMPCANARTLRATLFKDTLFKELVTNDVVPVWEMVRAVPKVEIDLGDGKKIKRIVRGNAVMYLCNPEGLVVDAYPGVYTAKDFFPMVRESIAELAHNDANTVLAYHRERGSYVAETAATMGKSVVESPTLNLLGAQTSLGAKSDEVPSSQARALFLRSARNIRDLSLTPMTPEEAVLKVTGGSIKGRDPKALAADIMQRDSTTNMNRVRPVVHLWMASETALPTPAQARDAILETILKIPYKDPYFGLKDVLLPGTE